MKILTLLVLLLLMVVVVATIDDHFLECFKTKQEKNGQPSTAQLGLFGGVPIT